MPASAAQQIYPFSTFKRDRLLFLRVKCGDEMACVAPVLEIGGKRSVQGSASPWKRFWQRFRSHDSKMAQLNVQLLYLLAESEEVPRSDIVRAAEALFDFGLATRNLAL
jgi:hypothetical protein